MTTPPPPAPTPSIGPTPIATTPIPPPSESFKGAILGIFVAMLILLIAVAVFSSPKKDKEVIASTAPVAQTPPAPVQTTEALVRRFKGKTPCSTKIEWPFQIWTDGRPVSVKFNGRRDWVPFPGEGEFNAPKMWYGDTQFKSPDTNHPIIDVWVYEVVTVRK